MATILDFPQTVETAKKYTLDAGLADASRISLATWVSGKSKRLWKAGSGPPLPEFCHTSSVPVCVASGRCHGAASYRIQHIGHGALNDLVLQRRHRQRPSAPVRFGYVNPPARCRPIRPALNRSCRSASSAPGLLRSPATLFRRSRRPRSWLSPRTRPAELPV